MPKKQKLKGTKGSIPDPAKLNKDVANNASSQKQFNEKNTQKEKQQKKK